MISEHIDVRSLELIIKFCQSFLHKVLLLLDVFYVNDRQLTNADAVVMQGRRQEGFFNGSQWRKGFNTLNKPIL